MAKEVVKRCKSLMYSMSCCQAFNTNPRRKASLHIIDASHLYLISFFEIPILRWQSKFIFEHNLLIVTDDVNSGEHTSKATKTARLWNMVLCNDLDKQQRTFGRRIDLIIANMDVELSSSEWKKHTTPRNLGIQQQVKNARVNKAMLKAVERTPLNDEDRDGLFVLGMDWIGK